MVSPLHSEIVDYTAHGADVLGSKGIRHVYIEKVLRLLRIITRVLDIQDL